MHLNPPKSLSIVPKPVKLVHNWYWSQYFWQHWYTHLSFKKQNTAIFHEKIRIVDIDFMVTLKEKDDWVEMTFFWVMNVLPQMLLTDFNIYWYWTTSLNLDSCIRMVRMENIGRLVTTDGHHSWVLHLLNYRIQIPTLCG